MQTFLIAVGIWLALIVPMGYIFSRHYIWEWFPPVLVILWPLAWLFIGCMEIAVLISELHVRYVLKPDYSWLYEDEKIKPAKPFESTGENPE
jgi:hypothetical protein